MTVQSKSAARPSSVTTGPIAGSRKIYSSPEGRPDIRVPFREIALDPSAREEPYRAYDCSGPYTDPAARIDLRLGLPALRAPWIAERGDTEELGDLTSRYGRARAADANLSHLHFAHKRLPRRAKAGANVTQMHYARQGIITPQMENIATR